MTTDDYALDADEIEASEVARLDAEDDAHTEARREMRAKSLATQHDPLCECRTMAGFVPSCACPLIARVRADEREKAAGCGDSEDVEGYVQGFADGLDRGQADALRAAHVAAMSTDEAVELEPWEYVRGRLDAAKAITRLPAAPEPDPALPKVVADALAAYEARYERRADGDFNCRDCASVVHTGITTLAPEPAPIEVGSWWQSRYGAIAVVTGFDAAGHPTLHMWKDTPDVQAVFLAADLREHWTPLDGPPEPPVGSVYMIGRRAWQYTSSGHMRVGYPRDHTWTDVLGIYTRESIATLHVLRVGA